MSVRHLHHEKEIRAGYGLTLSVLPSQSFPHLIARFLNSNQFGIDQPYQLEAFPAALLVLQRTTVLLYL